MLGFGEELTTENIYKKISSYDLFKAYCSPFKKVGINFISELRTDSNPSCVVNLYNGDLLYKDFGDLCTYRAIDYIKEKYKLSFFEVLDKINTDFALGLGILQSNTKNYKSIYAINKDIQHKEKQINTIQKRARKFISKDLDYWKQFGIHIDTLNKFNVEAIDTFWINDVIYFAAEYSYVYNFYWENDVFRRKIYQPFDSFKWASNGGKICQGENMLPYSGELLIITKSLKDVMSLWELGYTSVAPPSESTFLPIEYFNKQKDRFKKIVLFFDNDTAGIKMNKKFSEQLGIPYIISPELKAKDISDYIKIFGLNKAKELLKTLLYGL